LTRNGTTSRQSDHRDDRLDAAERGLEWDAALLKARRTVRQTSQLRRLLSGDTSPACPSNHGLPAGERRLASGSRDQEALFEGLRVSAAHVGGSWDCMIDGGGRNMRVRLTEPASKRVAWTGIGSRAQVLVAFINWLTG